MEPTSRLLLVGAVAAAAIVSSVAQPCCASGISVCWDDASPVFVQPLIAQGPAAGVLSGTIEVDPGVQITHFTYFNAESAGGQALAATFADEFMEFLASGATTYQGPIVNFSVGSESETGVYDQNPYDIQNPFPYLQLHDLGTATNSNVADYELIVVDQFPPLVDLNDDGSVNGADLGLLLGDWGCVGSSCVADLNGDEVVDGADLGLLLGTWTPS